ncbi:MAG TPA: dihydrofolate reductase family protein [Candidatus Limnocylindrales bacterium]|nr:dihydrofolate reductase family protein [Candidatus Limnocylindrales bacterium]
MTTRSTRPARGADPLERLFEAGETAPVGVRGGLTPPLTSGYDGDLAIPFRSDRPTVIANFVETIDGVVALDDEGETGGGEVSGFSPTDRFVMGILRALADVVLVGAGTVRSSHGGGWTAQAVNPRRAAEYTELRRTLGLPPYPTTIIPTVSGDLEPNHPPFADENVPIVLVAPGATAERLRAKGFAAHISIEAVDTTDTIAAGALLDLAARLGARLVLSEGGPHLIADLVADDLLDELFLTLAPQIAGRAPGAPRFGLVEGVDLWPERARWANLSSVRRAGDHLFLRYRFEENGR